MKILLVTGPDISLREPYSSGIEAFVVTLANQLVRGGHSVDVIARDAEANVLFNVIDLGKGLFHRLSEAQQLHRFAQMDMSEYDSIHYNLFIPEIYEIAASFDTPAFLTLHSPADAARIRIYRRLASRTAIQFVAVSSRIKEQWDEALHRDIPIIHNGIDLSRWQVKSDSGGDYLLWSARINADKNVVDAIHLANHLDMPLRITGRITDQKYFEQEVTPLLSDRIVYLGHTTQAELVNVASHASAFVATALWQEPFGLNTLEMLASGLPVVGYESAIPPDLQFPGVAIATSSQNWRNLIEPLERVRTTSPDRCRSFARTMNMEQMTDEYTALYHSKLSVRSEVTPVLRSADLLHYTAPVEL